MEEAERRLSRFCEAVADAVCPRPGAHRRYGVPILPSRADFLVIEGWYQAGIPLGLVVETCQRVLRQRARRLEAESPRGGPGWRRVGFRYLDTPVQEAWEEMQEMWGGWPPEGVKAEWARRGVSP